MQDFRDYSLQDNTKYLHVLNVIIQFNDKLIKPIGFQKAVIESEFNYKNCCNDEDGKEKVLDYKNMCFKNF